MRDRGHAVGRRRRDEHALSGHETRARERADDAVGRFERCVLERGVLARAEPPLIAREIGHRGERDEGDGEGQVGLERREEGGRVAAQAHAHHADGRGAARAQDARQRSQIGHDLAEALVGHAWVAARERRSARARARADAVEREHRDRDVEPPAVERADGPRALFDRPVPAHVTMDRDDRRASTATRVEPRVGGAVGTWARYRSPARGSKG